MISTRDGTLCGARCRARVNVTRAITLAIRKIRQESPALGRYLEGTVRTGTSCAYRPNPDDPHDFAL